MKYFLGIDTSNYRTSAAVCDERGNLIRSVRRLLPVKDGELGLRQSDALFAHTKALPSVVEELGEFPLAAVGYSSKPRDCEGSYMPCFLAGAAVARSTASLLGIPAYPFSHQAGHLQAALYSVSRDPEAPFRSLADLAEKETGFAPNGRFLAFHVSGGTTETLLYDNGKITLLGGTLDLNAGQLIDRVGVALGLPFPAGEELEKLAEGQPKTKGIKISAKGYDCNLAGLENMAKKLISNGESHEKVAAFTLDAVLKALDKMSENLVTAYPELPILFAGGVMSCKRIASALVSKYSSAFASPEFSGDNAVGTALLCLKKYSTVQR